MGAGNGRNSLLIYHSTSRRSDGMGKKSIVGLPIKLGRDCPISECSLGHVRDKPPFCATAEAAHQIVTVPWGFELLWRCGTALL